MRRIKGFVKDGGPVEAVLDGIVPGGLASEDQAGEVGGPEAVVDVHDGDVGGAAVEHAEQRAEAPEGRAVADARRHRDHGLVDQAPHHRGQGALHAGHHDHDPCVAQHLGRGEQPMDAGDAHVGEQLHLVAEAARDLLSLPGDRKVRGACADDGDGPLPDDGDLRWAEPEQPAFRVVLAETEPRQHLIRHFGFDARRQLRIIRQEKIRPNASDW